MSLDPPARWDAAAPLGQAAGPDMSGRWVAAAAIGLSVTGAAAPIAVALTAATNPSQWRPVAASALVALFVVAPAGAGVAAALAGLRRLAALVRAAGGEAEYAALRIAVATAMFGYALVLPALGAAGPRSAPCLPVAASALVLAWTLLLCVILWPEAAAPRRLAAIVLDMALFSAFLHFGGRQVAGWFPLYIVIVIYAGLRFGLAGLMTASIAAIVGFAAVVASTAAWHEVPTVAAGRLIALLVLPAPLAAAIRRLAAARGAVAMAEAGRRGLLLAISHSLRAYELPIHATLPAAAPIADILDFAALETGTFALPVETFELRTLIRNSLSRLQAEAAERGTALRWRVDPHLPNRLRGQAQTVGRILRGLAEHAIAAAPRRSVRLTIDAGARDPDRVQLELHVAGSEDDGGGPAGEALVLRLVRKLAASAGGNFAIEPDAAEGRMIHVALPLAIEEGARVPALDLDGRAVLIVTEDDALADELAAPLGDWNAEPRWPADADQAIAELAVADAAKRAVVVIDGRDKLLSALGIAHQAAKLGVNAPFVLLIAEPEQIDGLLAVDDGGIDGFIPAPPDLALIANALDALPLAPGRAKPPPEAAARPPPQRPRPASDAPRRDPARITPIASHPKFAPEAAPVDARALEGLQALGGDERFINELIEAFRLDAVQIMERIAAAAAAADGAGFAHGLVALRRAAGQLGGVQLCALTASLQHLGTGELRQRGSFYVQRLDLEIARLTEALTAFAAAEESRS
jgi:signal transduction histidine kinase